MMRDEVVVKSEGPPLEQCRPRRPAGRSSTVPPRTRRVGPTAVALVVGLAALTAQASETDLVRDIQRYCTVCWRNARLDPRLWDDCTQEVCCRLLTKAREGQLDLTLVLAEDTPERRELVRAIDMVRKRVQRAKRYQPLDGSTPTTDIDQRHRDRLELGEILEAARQCRAEPAPGPDHRAVDARLVRARDRRRSSICRSPASATRSTRPCASSSNISAAGATCSNSACRRPRR